MNLSIGKKIASGSNKEVYEIEGSDDLIAFRFTDRVSVFDYGALPEMIPDRGLNLMRFATVLQNVLERGEIPSAYDSKHSEELQHFVMRKAGGARWSLLKKKEMLTFVPLEVVFRWGAPKGSSLLKRRNDIGAGEFFESPLIEFYTKLEEQDRLLTDDEAQDLLPKGVSLDKIRQMGERVATLLKEFFAGIGLVLWDGKIEVAVDGSGRLLMVDAITPDELRLSLPARQDVPLSKELLRFWLSKTPWTFMVDEAKKRGSREWKTEIDLPPRLGLWRIGRIARLYQALADAAEKGESGPVLDWINNEEVLPKVHVIGSGGREAALKWRLALEGVSIVDDLMRADAVIVSPDGELANGRVNELSKLGIWAFGPTREASKIEWSKETGRLIARQAGIPTPHYVVVAKEKDLAKALEGFKDEIPVVKFDGLAAGKGVVVPNTKNEAIEAAKRFLKHGPILLEERWKGAEASVFFAVNSSRDEDVRFLGSAKDFKRRFLGDEGPNTGGMGAYSPHPDIDEEDIFLFGGWARSTAQVLRKAQKPFNGILYLGLMKDEEKGWGLIEYNARFGDPETQALISLWDPSQRVLRYLLQLDIQTELPPFLIEDAKSLCLSLVRPEYPDAAPAAEFPEWKVDRDGSQSPVLLFENESKTGRVGYLVAKDEDLLKAGDKVFQVLVESPWKGLVEWRSDILK